MLAPSSCVIVAMSRVLFIPSYPFLYLFVLDQIAHAVIGDVIADAVGLEVVDPPDSLPKVGACLCVLVKPDLQLALLDSVEQRIGVEIFVREPYFVKGLAIHVVPSLSLPGEVADTICNGLLVGVALRSNEERDDLENGLDDFHAGIPP
jgi:hypothetical protein